MVFLLYDIVGALQLVSLIDIGLEYFLFKMRVSITFSKAILPES